MGIALPVRQSSQTARGRTLVALIGNPNAGKTTLFNRLTGLRAKTANFPGTTIERRTGALRLESGSTLELLDLPGLYGLTAADGEEKVAHDALVGDPRGQSSAAAAIVVIDATNLARNLYLAGQVRELGVPVVVALNMMDLARAEGLAIDAEALAQQLAAPVVAVSARSGEGMQQLLQTLELTLKRHPDAILPTPAPLAACSSCGGCRHAARFDWAEDVAAKVSRGTAQLSAKKTEQIDRVLAHPVLGLGVFAMVMAAVFIAIFTVAQFPMSWIEAAFQALGARVGAWLPEGDLRSLIVDGIIGGVGGVLVFLPQICILFFFLSMLEDTGYLARAAFVMDRLMRKVGLPGKAFVPMISAHACAIPAIMATRVIEDKRDRLVSILILPLMTCSARLPVYAMVTALLFTGRPVVGGLVFAGAYALGIIMALIVAFVFKKTILRGESRPLVLELPTYKRPSLRNALLTTLDRGVIFLKRAGTVILLISIGLWAMVTYPKLADDQLGTVASAQTMQHLEQLQADADKAEKAGDSEKAEALKGQAEKIASQLGLEYSLAGRMGKAVEPVFRPLGFDWRINVGVLTSFAARETVVSTLAIVYGVGEEGAEDTDTLRDTLKAQVRPDGKPVFGLATTMALLVFYVLAMQCLPTQAVTRRETGSWKWALFQLGYMTVLAYSMALITYQGLSALGA